MPSTSAKQARFMQAIAHSPSFAKKVGVKQSVGKDFAAADKGKLFNKGGMMAKIKRYNGATEDGSDIYSDRDENPEAQEVERKTFAGGVRMSPDYLTKPASAAPYRMSQADVDESARNEALIKRDAANARDKDNMATNRASNRASSAYQDTMRKAAATNERQAARARASDDGKDYSGNGLRTAGNVAGAIGGGAAATAALLAGQPLAARMIASRTAVPAAKEVLGSVFRSNRTTGVEKAGEGAARAVAKEAARRESTPNTTASAVKPGGRVRDEMGPPAPNKTASMVKPGGKVRDEMGPPAPNKTASAVKPGGKIRDTKGPTPAEMEKLVNEGKVALKKGGNVKNLRSLFKGKESYGEELKEAKAIKSGKISPQQYAKGEDMEKTKKYAKGGGIESRGKTKGTIIRMAMGGSVSSASRRADGIAQRGKTRC